MIINFEMFKFYKTEVTRGARSYDAFLESMKVDAKYGTQVYQFICNTRSQHVKERVCLSLVNRTS